MFVSDFLLNTAFDLASRNHAEKAKSYFNYYLEEVNKLKRFDRLIFGKYRMSNGYKPNDLDIVTPISWEILEKRGTRLLLISEFCLDWNFYNGNCMLFGPSADTTWENSTIREDLNSSFLEESFIPREKAMIVTAEIKTMPNPICGNNPGKVTHDKVFLLSYDEVLKYYSKRDGEPLSDDEIYRLNGEIISKREQFFNVGNFAARSDILMFQKHSDNKFEIYREDYQWWLRTPGSTQKEVAVINEYGEIDFGGVSSSADEIGIRPAMWIDLDIAKQLLIEYADANY